MGGKSAVTGGARDISPPREADAPNLFIYPRVSRAAIGNLRASNQLGILQQYYNSFVIKGDPD